MQKLILNSNDNQPPLGDIAEARADNALINHVFINGLIDVSTRRKAMDYLNGPREWGLWSYRLLLASGALLTLSGIIFFFAYNWQDIPAAAKLFTIEGAMIVCALFALFVGLDRPIGQILALSASVLVGVFLAVFGQIYQTGADSWVLFALWSGLILPWGIIARCTAHWGLFVLISNIGLFLLVREFYSMGFSRGLGLATTALCILNCAFYFLAKTSKTRIGHNWLESILALAVIAFATFASSIAIFEHSGLLSVIFSAQPEFVALIMIPLAVVYFNKVRPNILLLAAALAGLGIIGNVAIDKMLFLNGFARSDISMVTTIVTITSGLTLYALTRYLIKFSKHIGERK